MEVEFDVKITKGIVFDYLVHNLYSKPVAIVATVIGICLMASTLAGQMIYIGLLGAAIVFYLPLSLWSRAGKIAKEERFRDRNYFLLNENGIIKVEGNDTKKIAWNDISRAFSTRSSIIVLTSEQKACIFPRKDMQEKTAKVIEMISTHVPPGCVDIRA